MNQREPLEFVFLTTNRKTAKKSVTRKIYKLYIKLDITRERNLFLFRECLIVQSLAMGISQIVYSASLLDISPDNISRNKRAIFNFIYNIASKFVWSNSIAWACFIFLLCTLMTSANKSLGKKIEIVIKQLVHTSYEVRGKFGEHSRSWSCPRRSR